MTTALDTAANLTGASVTEAQMKTWFTAMRAAMVEMGDPMARYGIAQNLGFSLSVSGNALTIALKTRALSDADANNPISIPFRNATVATGDFSVLNINAASSLVVSSGSKVGTRDAIPFRLWIVAFNDGGTWRLGVINCVTTVAGALVGSDVIATYPLQAWGIASSTAEGGAGAADSAQVFYTGTAVTAKAYAVLGYATWETGLATAGTWSAGPTRIQIFGHGVPLPGQSTGNFQRSNTGASATGTTVVPYDDTPPLITDGDQYMSQAITGTSAANIFKIKHNGMYSFSGGSEVMQVSLYQDATSNPICTMTAQVATATIPTILTLDSCILVAATAATTFRIRGGASGGPTNTFNGSTSTRRYGGAANSFLEIEERMG